MVKIEKEGKEKHHLKGEKHHHKPEITSWLIPLIVFGVLSVITAIIVLPTKVLSYQVEVPYIDKEQYTVEVPYEDVEEYIVQVPYETQEQYVESAPYTEQEPYQVTECAFLGLFCQGVTKYRTVTKYKDVIKTKPVTKYRDETRYKKVTNS